jgi:uncharacterized protein (DUF1697 family)
LRPGFDQDTKGAGANCSQEPLAQSEGDRRFQITRHILVRCPPKTAAKVLDDLATTRERFRILNREIYLHCPDGYGNSKLTNNTIEKKFSLVATTRNWRTVNALLEMAGLRA